MEKEFGLIAKMYAVADEFDVPLPPEELALYRTLLPSFSHLKVSPIFQHPCCLLSSLLYLNFRKYTLLQRI